jgi:hypothetical protein
MSATCFVSARLGALRRRSEKPDQQTIPKPHAFVILRITPNKGSPDCLLYELPGRCRNTVSFPRACKHRALTWERALLAVSLPLVVRLSVQ